MMKDFQRLIDESINEVKAAGITPGNIVDWRINTRAKCRWGLCRKLEDGSGYVIEIAHVLLINDVVSEKDCKTTMIHEILHTCEGTKGHTGLWKQYAAIMNAKYGYNIKRTTSGAEKGLAELDSIVHRKCKTKYICKCKSCGLQLRRTKASRLVKYPDYYNCDRCGQNNWDIRKVG